MTDFLPNDAAADEEQFLVLALRYLDGVADAEEEAALARWIHSSPQCREWFVVLCGQVGMMHEVFAARPHEELEGGLRMLPGGLGTLVPSEVVTGQRPAASPGAAVELPHQPDGPQAPVPGPEPLIPPIIIDVSSPSPASLFSINSPLGGWLVSYGVATLLVGAAILGGWLYKVSHDYQLATVEKDSREPTAPGEGADSRRLTAAGRDQLVGRITGTADCKWADPESVPAGLNVPVGQAYSLSAGLMEITYATGAKVILQGPCTYEVSSESSGFLSLGKLTARVETKGEGGRRKAEGTENQKSEVGSQESPFPLPPSPFVVRTPTAIVTDLGTEFGVEVDRFGATRSHVFRGKVELRVAGGRDEDSRPIPLGEGESARVERGGNQTITVVKTKPGISPRDTFARRMPQRLPIKLFNTGIGLKEGDADPHWQIVAVSNDPKFKPQAAVVTVVVPIYVENDPEKSQWISTAGDLPKLPNNVFYTFRTTFELPDLFPGTAVLAGWFVADNHVKAIRLNGVQVPVTQHGWDPPYALFHSFATRKGFVEGTNSLEFDVENGVPGIAGLGDNPMLLRVEVEGSFLGGHRTLTGKEGAPMN